MAEPVTDAALDDAAELTEPVTDAVPAHAAELTEPATADAADLTEPATVGAADLTEPAPTDAAELTEPAPTDVAEVTSAFLTASRLLVGIVARSLAGAEERVTLRQLRLLVLLESRGETNLVTLAEALAVNPSTALRMVDRLVDAGLVARRTNPASRREVLLQLTQAGKELVDAVTARRREEIAAVIAKMPPPDRAGLVRALRAFAAAGNEYPDEEIDRDLMSLGWH